MATDFDPNAVQWLTPDATKQSYDFSTKLRYELKGRPAFAYANIILENDQTVVADTSAMLWVDHDLTVDTYMAGWPWEACCRTFSGEPCCMNSFANTTGGRTEVALGFELPGDMMAFGVDADTSWLLTTTSFVGSTDNVAISGAFSGCGACCCADEGPFLTTVSSNDSNPGIVFAGGYGVIARQVVADGEQLYVSAGLFFAAEASQGLACGLVGQECCGCKNLCCTGTGIVLSFDGPCTIYTQSRNDYALRRMFAPPPPPPEGGGGAELAGEM